MLLTARIIHNTFSEYQQQQRQQQQQRPRQQQQRRPRQQQQRRPRHANKWSRNRSF